MSAGQVGTEVDAVILPQFPKTEPPPFLASQACSRMVGSLASWLRETKSGSLFQSQHLRSILMSETSAGSCGVWMPQLEQLIKLMTLTPFWLKSLCLLVSTRLPEGKVWMVRFSQQSPPWNWECPTAVRIILCSIRSGVYSGGHSWYPRGGGEGQRCCRTSPQTQGVSAQQRIILPTCLRCQRWETWS